MLDRRATLLSRGSAAVVKGAIHPLTLGVRLAIVVATNGSLRVGNEKNVELGGLETLCEAGLARHKIT